MLLGIFESKMLATYLARFTPVLVWLSIGISEFRAAHFVVPENMIHTCALEPICKVPLHGHGINIFWNFTFPKCSIIRGSASQGDFCEQLYSFMCQFFRLHC